jgi:hypothetical protein
MWKRLYSRLEDYVYGTSLNYPFKKITSNGQVEKKEGGLTFDLVNNIIKINTEEPEKELRVKLMIVFEQSITLGGYIGMDKAVFHEYKYHYEEKLPANLVSDLSYVSKKVNKQITMKCTNSIFHFWKRLNNINKKPSARFDSTYLNDNFFISSLDYFEEGTLEFTNDGKVTIKDEEFYFYNFEFKTNEKSDQAEVVLYYSEINAKINDKDKIDLHQKMKSVILYFSLAEGCKEELRKALRNKTTCFPIKDGIEFTKLLTEESDDEGKTITITKDFEMVDITYIKGGTKFIKNPFIRHDENTNTVQIESMATEFKLNEVKDEKFEINFPKSHPCSEIFEEIKEKQKATIGLKPLIQSNKPNIEFLISKIDNCKNSHSSRKDNLFFKFKNGKITSILNGKRFTYIYTDREKEGEKMMSYKEITFPKDENCFKHFCPVTFDSITFEFDFGGEECFELFKRAFSDHIFTQKINYQNYYFKEVKAKQLSKPVYINNNSIQGEESQLSLSNFNIEEIGMKINTYNKLDIFFYRKEYSVMVEYIIRNGNGFLRSRYWFEFKDKNDINELEKYVYGSSIVFTYHERDGGMVNGQITFILKENLVHIYESNILTKVDVKFIHFDGNNLIIKGYNEKELKIFDSIFKTEAKSVSLNKQLEYVKAKMSKVENDEIRECKGSKFSYWGVYNLDYKKKVIFNTSIPSYTNKLVSLEQGTIEFMENGIIKITNEKSESFFYYYHFDLRTSESNNYILSIEITYSAVDDIKVGILQTDFHFTLSNSCKTDLKKLLMQQATCDMMGNFFFGKDNDTVSFPQGEEKLIGYRNQKLSTRTVKTLNPRIVIDEKNELYYKGEKIHDSESVEEKRIPINNLPKGHPCYIKLYNLIQGMSTAEKNTYSKIEQVNPQIKNQKYRRLKKLLKHK